jgi:hypothetical protein
MRHHGNRYKAQNMNQSPSPEAGIRVGAARAPTACCFRLKECRDTILSTA